MPNGIGGIGGDYENYLFFQKRPSLCLSNKNINRVTPNITYKEDAPMEWGTYHVEGCEGHLFSGIDGMKEGGVAVAETKDVGKRFQFHIKGNFDLSTVGAVELKENGAPEKIRDISALKIGVDSFDPILINEETDKQFGKITWIGDINGDKKIDFLFDSDNGETYGSCNADAYFYFSTKDGYRLIYQPMAGCI